MIDELPPLTREVLEIAAAVLESEKSIHPNSRIHKLILEELERPKLIDCGRLQVIGNLTTTQIRLDDGIYRLTAERIEND